MRYLALAADYDGTLATDGRVPPDVVRALEDLKRTGRRLIMVTGRELPDLKRVCDRLELFDRVVAENGALLYDPATGQERALCHAPRDDLVEMLRARNVSPLSVGSCIVATWRPNENIVLECIRDLGLELQVVFNKGAVMVLPSGVNKASGLSTALEELGLSAHNVVGIGDAENDHAFLSMCECSVAVANALAVLKDSADLVMGDHGAGVAELASMLVEDDLEGAEAQLARHHVLVGEQGGEEIRIPTYGENVLVVGPSESGKSTFTTGMLERLCDAGYQYCLIDPEGDYQSLDGALPIGTAERAPTADEVMSVLEQPSDNPVAVLLDVSLAERPAFLEALLPRLQELRARTGRPHWIVIDEAHHMLHSKRVPAPLTLPQQLKGMLFITIHPDRIKPEILKAITIVVATGDRPEEVLRAFAQASGEEEPKIEGALGEGQAVLWRRGATATRFTIASSRSERRRHIRKYAEGELDEEFCFYFRGPDNKLNLRAQNLMLFMQLADGVDDATWTFHLERGDYSSWFRDHIKDEDLAIHAAEIEERRDLSPAESRARIREEIEKRYTAPA